jgi:hypothetical protein
MTNLEAFLSQIASNQNLKKYLRFLLNNTAVI